MTKRDAPLVLVVDDYDDAREMYCEFLEHSGFRVAQARDGLEAVTLAKALTPDVVLMDLSLPVIDGIEATRQLKADRRTGHIAVIALSGHTLPSVCERALSAGCAAFLAKPCLPEALMGEVRRVLAG